LELKAKRWNILTAKFQMRQSYNDVFFAAFPGSSDSLCVLVVTVRSYRSEGAGSIPEVIKLFRTVSTQPRDDN
jgi:hypothetical protein